MTDYITDVAVSINAIDEQNLQEQGYRIINENLNKGTGGARIFLWYKTGANRAAAITKLQVSFNEGMTEGLNRAGYTKITKNLNAGTGGKPMYLWYFKGSGEYDTPIERLSVTTSAPNEGRKLKNGWERLACDLNRGVCGYYIHIWMKRSEHTYICDVDATDSYGVDEDNFRDGYIRIDEDTNRSNPSSFVFIWYRQTTNPDRGLTDLQISNDNKERERYQQQGYKSADANLNDQSGGEPVYLWYKKTKADDPIEDVTLIVNENVVQDYKKNGINVIEKNLNAGSNNKIYLCFKN